MPDPTNISFQLDVLKSEIELIDRAIARMDEITKNVKQWTVALWTGAVGGALSAPDLRFYVGLTAIIPLIFWLVDAWHRRIQRKFIWRGQAIAEFLNDGRLQKSIDSGSIVGFRLLDPKGDCHQTDSGYDSFISARRIFFFRSISLIYGGLLLSSLTLAIVVRLFPIHM